MKLVFNENGAGQTEIKATLGFLDADYTYANIEPDIKLNTPYLIDLISQEVYDRIQAYYKNPTPVDADTQTALEYVQLYILSMAYLDFAPNNDLTHSGSGRAFSSDENEKIPWDWQLNADNTATVKRAYKALDQLFLLLEKTGWTEWTGSDAYKTANALFLKNTNIFDKAFPINKSGQLYYRLVPFMEDIETEHIAAILGATKVTELKAATTPTDLQKTLLALIYKAVAYVSLSRGFKAFPVQMFPDSFVFKESARDISTTRIEVMDFLAAEGKKYLKKLEYEFTQQNATFVELNTMPGLTEGKKYVNL